MSAKSGNNFLATVVRMWPSLGFLLVLLVVTTAAASTSGQSGDGTIHNLRLSSSPVLSHHDIVPIAPSTAAAGESGKSRKTREVSRLLDQGGEDDLTSSSAAAALGQDYSQSRQSAKVKTLYPPLSGSGFGYFNRGGRAASSNFIRFGRSGMRYFDDEDALNGGGDVSMLNRNNAKKKNNFIRLGRENPRQTNFIRLGRSGPPSPGEFYNSGYITPALSDPFREEEDGRHELN